MHLQNQQKKNNNNKNNVNREVTSNVSNKISDNYITNKHDNEIDITEYSDTSIEENAIIEASADKTEREVHAKIRQLNTLNIATLNVNGVNDIQKQVTVLEELHKEEYSIIGISETHMTERELKYSFLHANLGSYRAYWAGDEADVNEHRKGGVGIILYNTVAKHLIRVQKVNNHLISIVLYFKKLKVNIVQLYMPTKEKKQKRSRIENKISQIIKDDSDNKVTTIIMGDFNMVSNPKIDRTPARKDNKSEAKLLIRLEEANFVDTQKAFSAVNAKHTWARGDSSSRIDMIWISSMLTCHTLDIIAPHDTAISTDHKLIGIKIEVKNAITNDNNKIKRKVIDWENSTQQQVNSYQMTTNSKATLISRRPETQNMEEK
jgi:exonuclease III